MPTLPTSPSAVRPVPVEQPANVNAGSASQLLANLNSLMVAALCAGLLLLIVEALVLLRKLRPNPELKFKVEVNHPQAMAASEPIAQMIAPIAHVAPITQPASTPHIAPITQAAPIAHVAPITQVTPTADVTSIEQPISIALPTPTAKVAPIYALKRQMEEAIEHHQEDAMMRQVFDENLKLREQLEDSRIAA